MSGINKQKIVDSVLKKDFLDILKAYLRFSLLNFGSVFPTME